MDAVTRDGTTPVYLPIPTIVNSVGCTGACVYQWNGQSYGWVSGRCTGAPSCSPCPPSFGTEVRNLVLQLPTLFPDPNNISLKCGVVTSNQVNVILMQLFVDAMQQNTSQVLLSQTNMRYRNTCIGLGVLFLLSLAGLVYSLFFR